MHREADDLFKIKDLSKLKSPLPSHLYRSSNVGNNNSSPNSTINIPKSMMNNSSNITTPSALSQSFSPSNNSALFIKNKSPSITQSHLPTFISPIRASPVLHINKSSLPINNKNIKELESTEDVYSKEIKIATPLMEINETGTLDPLLSKPTSMINDPPIIDMTNTTNINTQSNISISDPLQITKIEEVENIDLNIKDFIKSKKKESLSEFNNNTMSNSPKKNLDNKNPNPQRHQVILLHPPPVPLPIKKENENEKESGKESRDEKENENENKDTIKRERIDSNTNTEKIVNIIKNDGSNDNDNGSNMNVNARDENSLNVNQINRYDSITTAESKPLSLSLPLPHSATTTYTSTSISTSATNIPINPITTTSNIRDKKEPLTTAATFNSNIDSNSISMNANTNTNTSVNMNMDSNVNVNIKEGSTTVALSDWSFSLIPNNPKFTGYDKEFLPNWVVLVGKRQDLVELWHSSIVTERLGSTFVLTGSGRIYEIIPPLDELGMMDSGFSMEFCKKFQNEFPLNWKDLLISEIQKISLLKDKDKNSSLSSSLGKVTLTASLLPESSVTATASHHQKGLNRQSPKKPSLIMMTPPLPPPSLSISLPTVELSITKNTSMNATTKQQQSQLQTTENKKAIQERGTRGRRGRARKSPLNQPITPHDSVDSSLINKKKNQSNRRTILEDNNNTSNKKNAITKNVTSDDNKAIAEMEHLTKNVITNHNDNNTNGTFPFDGMTAFSSIATDTIAGIADADSIMEKSRSRSRSKLEITTETTTIMTIRDQNHDKIIITNNSSSNNNNFSRPSLLPVVETPRKSFPSRVITNDGSLNLLGEDSPSNTNNNSNTNTLLTLSLNNGNSNNNSNSVNRSKNKNRDDKSKNTTNKSRDSSNSEITTTEATIVKAKIQGKKERKISSPSSPSPFIKGKNNQNEKENEKDSFDAATTTITTTPTTFSLSKKDRNTNSKNKNVTEINDNVIIGTVTPNNDMMNMNNVMGDDNDNDDNDDATSNRKDSIETLSLLKKDWNRHGSLIKKKRDGSLSSLGKKVFYPSTFDNENDSHNANNADNKNDNTSNISNVNDEIIGNRRRASEPANGTNFKRKIKRIIDDNDDNYENENENNKNNNNRRSSNIRNTPTTRSNRPMVMVKRLWGNVVEFG